MKSIKTPFSFSGGKVAETRDPNVVATQKISDVLQTSNFERVLRPEYGSSVKYLVNDIADTNQLADVRVEALQDLSEYITSMSVLDVQFDTASVTTEDTTLNMYVTYQLPLGVVSTSNVQIAVPGLITEDTGF